MANASQLENQSYLYSAALHLLVLLVGIFGLPEFWEHHRDSLPVAMTVEVLPIGQTNIKPKQASKATTKKTKKPAPKIPAWKKSRRPKPKETIKKPLPLPKKETPKPKKEVIKPKPTPKKAEPAKPKEMDLADILRNVEKAAQGESDTPTPQESSKDSKRAISENYNDALPLAMSEVDAIRQQIIKNWNIPAGAKNAYKLIIVLEVHLTQTGIVTSVGLAKDKSRYYSDNFFRAAADSAIRAVRRSSPLQNLPTDKYGTWKHIELSFDPKEVLY